MKTTFVILVFDDKKLIFSTEYHQIQELKKFLYEFFSAYFQEREVDFSSFSPETVEEGFKIVYGVMKKF